MAVSEEESSSASGNNSKSLPSHGGPHYLAKCVLKGSVVLQIVYGHIRSPSSKDIVFGKETSLELVIIDDYGVLQSICEQPVFGTIKDLAILPWNRRASPQVQGKDLLLVTSDSGKLSVLTFSNEMHRFFPLTQVQLSSSPGNLRHHVGRMLAVDSNGCFIATSAYEDRLALFSVSSSGGADIIDKKIFCPSDIENNTSTSTGVSGIHGTIWSMCFISKDMSQPHKEHNPVLAILLNRKGSLLNELLLLEWNTRENFVHVLSQYAELGPLAHDIVEVPNSYGFAFLFRVSDALLMDLRDAHNPLCVYRTSLNFLPSVVDEHTFVEESYRTNDVDEEGNICNVAASALLELKDIIKDDDPMNIDDDSGYSSKSTSNRVCSWSWEPGNEENPRMIFCVDTGELFMIELSSDPTGLKVNLSDCLYKGLPFKELLWAEGGFFTALAEMGDGMVLKIEEGKLQYKSPVQNISPILDMSLVDYHDEKHEQMFACCGMAPEGSLRVIRNGISLEKLLKTAPVYQGITGTWAMKMKLVDCYHSFLVLSFVEETRVLSVGVSFTDVTDSVGFSPDVCTLACGIIGDGLVVQIHQNAVRLALPTAAAHPDGIPFTSPNCTSWFPDNMTISLGAVGHKFIVVATSNPCYLFVLGVRRLAAYQYEVYQLQHVRLDYELSCISIPQKPLQADPSNSFYQLSSNHLVMDPTNGVEIGNTFVIGTHRPSVEVLSFIPDQGIRALAIGIISLVNSTGTTISGSVPQDVRLVQVDRLYILSGLRNGMLLRFEWPSVSTNSSLESPKARPYVSSINSFTSTSPHSTSAMHSCIISEMTKDNVPVCLQLISIRRIGITPAFLVPLNDLPDADVIALSDRPWLLQTARHSLSYTSISFQASTHATPVCSKECPNGILFVSENSLHLLEMVHSKRLNVQKFHLEGTPRKVLYHAESRLLLVLRTDLSENSCSSDICCVDPLSGSVLSSFKLDPGETGKCMELLKVGSEQVLVVGTSLSTGPAIMPSGEAESTRGRLIVLCLEHKQNSDSGSMTFYSKAGSSSQRTSPFREISGCGAEQLSSSSLCSSPDDNSSDGIKLEETEVWNLRLAYSTNMRGIVLAICPYLGCYFLASAGSAFYVCSFQNDNSLRVKRLAVGRTRFMIMTLTTHFTTIAVGDCRDGILFYAYYEDAKKVEQLYSDPVQRLVADCLLMNIDTAVVSDRKGSIAVLSCSHHSGENASPECNLKVCSSFYMGEIAMSIRKGSFSYKLLADDEMRDCDIASSIMDLSHSSIVASTLLGSIMIFVPISRDEFELLEDVQSRIAVHPLTAPILGNDHNEFRSRQSSVWAGIPKILDGDMLAQFLELTNTQQEDVLALPRAPHNIFTSRSSKPPLSRINVNKVVRLLERVHYALN
ncbi:pre-mRNA-splicing factor prp12 isoform X1 [Cynara cardunculus var. scolymus]|uniref:pre-mRNA-splicing factor prp12 isoform X1 n=1 Tax=Cynara cardunculus var. scolymus TaxID=59895 RepID=UPI000D629041|nr:pre-mRNA-splicing factor prp12 isoform X1 [Cynara cardunculus var. scolymus]